MSESEEGCTPGGCILGLIALGVVNLLLWGGQRLWHQSDFRQLDADIAYLKTGEASILGMEKELEGQQQDLSTIDGKIIGLGWDVKMSLGGRFHVKADDEDPVEPSKLSPRAIGIVQAAWKRLDFTSPRSLSAAISEEGGRVSDKVRGAMIIRLEELRTAAAAKEESLESSYNAAVDAYNQHVKEANELSDRTHIWLLWPKPIAIAVEAKELYDAAQNGTLKSATEDIEREHKVNEALDKMLEGMRADKE